MSGAMAHEVPFPVDVYTAALEEFLLLNTARSLLQQQGHGTVPPAMGMAVRNDLIAWAVDALSSPYREDFLRYVEALDKKLRRCLPTFLPEPLGEPGPTTLQAEIIAWHFLNEGGTPIWSAVRQAVSALAWQPCQRTFGDLTPTNVLVGAFHSGPYTGITKSTKLYPSFSRLINRFIQHLYPSLIWSTFSISRNLRTPPHRDHSNAPTGSLLTALSHHDGGGLWLEDGCGEVYEDVQGNLKCGRIVRLDFQCLVFPAHRMTHSTCGWEGTDRITLAAYCIGTVAKLTKSQFALLENFGFCPRSSLPDDDFMSD